jgi:hypothetical protein
MDTPLAINEINVDRYPLVKPVDLTYQVTLLSPENKSYESSTLPVVFFATAPEGWMGYSLDSQQNVTVQGEAVLENLTEGTHRLTVYTGQNGSGACASETVYFTIKTTETEQIESEVINQEPTNTEQEPEPTENTETSQPSTEIAPNSEGTEPEPTNPEEPAQTEEPEEPEEPTEAPLITTEIAITIAAVAVAAIGVAAYWALRKRK